ncbi:MAG: hypothetical protein PHX62_08540 [Bacilli bacterium]|nr:hypothetical protein [Bacilli bacterium]
MENEVKQEPIVENNNQTVGQSQPGVEVKNQPPVIKNKGKLSKKKTRLLICIITLIILGVGGYFVYTLSFNGSEISDDSLSNNVDDDIKDEEELVLTQSKFEKIVDDELDILDGKISINEVTNEDKLRYSFWRYKLDAVDYTDSEVYGSDTNTFAASILDQYFAKTCIGYLGLKDENFGLFNAPAEIWYFYNSNTKTYTLSPSPNVNTGFERVISIYQKTVSYEVLDNKYVLASQFLWVEQFEGTSPEVYGSYNLTEVLYTISEEVVNTDNVDLIEEEVEKYAEKNYESIKNKVDTYYYTFEVVDGKIRLTDFEVKKGT